MVVGARLSTYVTRISAVHMWGAKLLCINYRINGIPRASLDKIMSTHIEKMNRDRV